MSWVSWQYLVSQIHAKVQAPAVAYCA